jgi:predicted Zn-dependent peptidase
MGGSLIASSDDDAVSMGGEVLSEFADRYVALVADVVRHPRFSTADVARLRTNMIRDNAIALSEPGQISRATFRRLMFGDHPYGRIFAPESLLAHYDSASVRRFYTKNYDARRARLYVSGVFEDSTVERAVRAAFAGWPGGKPATINAPRPADRRQVELVDRPDAVQSTIRLGLPVADPDSPDWIRLSVTDAILGGAFGSRITSNIREDKGYSYSPFSYLSPWPGTALWIDIADVTTSVTGASLKEIFYEVDRLRGEPPGVKELDGIKQNLAGIFTIQNSSRYGLIGQLQFVDLYRLGDAYITNYVRNVVGVTPEEVQNTARRYLDPSRMTITVVGDRKTVESQLAPYRASTP